MKFRVKYETRKVGSIGVFSQKETVIEVPDNALDAKKEAINAAREYFNWLDYECRFPIGCEKIN